jgi:hypothetical protein
MMCDIQICAVCTVCAVPAANVRDEKLSRKLKSGAAVGIIIIIIGLICSGLVSSRLLLDPSLEPFLELTLTMAKYAYAPLSIVSE